MAQWSRSSSASAGGLRRWSSTRHDVARPAVLRMPLARLRRRDELGVAVAGNPRLDEFTVARRDAPHRPGVLARAGPSVALPSRAVILVGSLRAFQCP